MAKSSANACGRTSPTKVSGRPSTRTSARGAEREALPETLAILPIGATEAHGPHLPLDTDTIIAVRLAARVAALLPSSMPVIVAPAFTATAASFAAAFPGTLSTEAEEERQGLTSVVRALWAAGATRVLLVNLHFDPEHMRAVRAAVKELVATRPRGVVFPDFTRRALAEEIGGEFATGACHGGMFETSLVLATAPEKVLPVYETLSPIQVNLAEAIRAGKRSFVDLGMNDAYCGSPALATVIEGERLFDVLAAIVLRECGAT